MHKIMTIATALLLLAIFFIIPSPVSALPFFGLNSNGSPIYGPIEINAALGQPVSTNIEAGGPEDINLFFNKDTKCQGFASTAPSFTVQVNKKQSALRFFAISKGDTTLVIRSPNGKWYCDDDTIGIHPMIDFPAPAIGTYKIWVGSYNLQERPQTIFVVSNDEYSPSNYLGISNADQQLAALTGTGGPTSEIDVASEATVVVQRLNIRTGPGTNNAISATLTRGAVVTVLNQVRSCQWLNILYYSPSGEIRRGWIAGSRQYIQLNVACNTISESVAASASPMYIRNSCPRPIDVAIRYRKLSGEWLTDGWWHFEPKTASYLTNSASQAVVTDNAKFYFYAAATDGSGTIWAGDEEKLFQGKRLPMREIDLRIDSYGDYELNLFCDNASNIHYYDFVCLKNPTDQRINYSFRWNDGQWELITIDPRQNRRHWWELRNDETTSPTFEIRFDANLTNAVSNIEYWLPKKRTTDTACRSGQQYEFRLTGNNRIDLVKVD